MIFHLEIPHLLPGGYVGVDVFFVLSGFLITFLLIGEWDNRQDRISFRDFYARRALRLFPALGCVILVAAVLAGIVEVAGRGGDSAYSHATFTGIPWVLLYIGNWAWVLNISNLGWLASTWSLCVEEQFYLLWPALFVLLSRRGFRRDRLAISMALLAVAEMIYRAVMSYGSYSPTRIYYGTDTHSDGLLVGCAIAFWISARPPALLRPLAVRALRSSTWLGAAVLVMLVVFGASWADPYYISAAVLATAMVLVGLVTGGYPASLGRLLSSPIGIWVGRRSYGLYLWHRVVYLTAWAVYFHFTNNYAAAGLGERSFGIDAVDGAAVILAFVAAALSYRIVELPALRLKRLFRGQPARGRHRRPAQGSPGVARQDLVAHQLVDSDG
jgi:peptidoglycan/LPS O-acetylase OafA/YrhL